jgi:FHA domain-containing protein/uncharacterized protein DUF1707
VSLGAPAHLRSRPSAGEREQVIRALRKGRETERLSLDTFSARVELALTAKTEAQLADLLADLPARHPLGRLILAAVGRLSWWAACVGVVWREARTPLLALPRRGELTLGRSRECDWTVNGATVSRKHALLRRDDDGKWLLYDLGSTNGTFVNGWKVLNEVEVHAGDQVSFGELNYRLTQHR